MSKCSSLILIFYKVTKLLLCWVQHPIQQLPVISEWCLVETEGIKLLLLTEKSQHTQTHYYDIPPCHILLATGQPVFAVKCNLISWALDKGVLILVGFGPPRHGLILHIKANCFLYNHKYFSTSSQDMMKRPVLWSIFLQNMMFP